MRERAVCRLITNPKLLLTNDSSTIAPCEVPGPRAIGNEHMPHILEVLGALSSLPSYVSLYIIWNPSPTLADPRLQHLYTRTVLNSYIEIPAGQQRQ